jgi:hypothetical protein
MPEHPYKLFSVAEADSGSPMNLVAVAKHYSAAQQQRALPSVATASDSAGCDLSDTGMTATGPLHLCRQLA